MKTLFLVFLLFDLALVTPIASLCHNHEIDGEYHDGCSACRFDLQTLGDDPEEIAISMDAKHSLTRSGGALEIQSICREDQSLLAIKLTRAPPSNF